MNSVLAMQNHNFGPMAQFALFLMSISAVFMATLAASAGGYLVPAAITTCVYTASSVNNAFEAKGNPLFRVFGSHAAAIINVLMIVISLKTAPTSP